jgi:hypothetical protein
MSYHRDLVIGAEKGFQMMSMSGMMISATLTQSHNWKVLKKCFQTMPISYLMSHVTLTSCTAGKC